MTRNTELSGRQRSRTGLLVLCCLCLLLCVSAQNVERQRITFGDTSDKATCRIEMEGLSGRGRRSAILRAFVECNDERIYNAELPAGDIEEIELEHGIKLFSETRFGGMAFVYLDSDSDANLIDSLFLELPEIESRDLAAPLVIEDANLDITQTAFESNQAGFVSGGIIAGGRSNVDFYNVTFFSNLSEEGVLHLTGSTRADVDYCYFRDNNGTEVGALKISQDSVVRVSEGLFEVNFGEEMANEIYISNRAVGFIDETAVYGDDFNAEFEAFLNDDSRPDNEAENFALPRGGVATVSGRATALFTDSLMSGHYGQTGAIHVTGAPVFSAVRTDFSGNRALTGGGLFVNAERAGFARALECNFTNNIARFGGGLVMAGNGTYTLDTCHFEDNSALSGGAIWGDYSEENTCPRASSGARVTILENTFINNTAQRSGGAFFVRCTDILAENTVFHENTALNGDGGVINAASTFDLRFNNCSFTQNRASGSGGVFYVNGSNDIVMDDDCVLTDNTAGEDGGTIALLNGHGIIFGQTQLRNSTCGRHGGAIFASNVEMIDFDRTSIRLNDAQGRGGVFHGTDIQQFSWRRLEPVVNNNASSAGVIYIEGGDSFELRRVEFSDNRAIASGSGAVELIDVQNVSLSDAIFEQNTASETCGALSVTGALNLRMNDSVIDTNSGTAGGGMCISNATNVRLEAVEFVGNEASEGSGGAIRIRGGGSYAFVSSSFIDNRAAASEGGALHVEAVDGFSAEDTFFIENTAAAACGAISIATVDDFEMSDSTLDGNTGTVGGAVCISDGESMSFRKVEITRNVASDGDGGALHITEGGSLVLVDLTMVQNNNASRSGGAFYLSGLQSARIEGSTIRNSTVSDTGGCLVANSVRKLTLRDSIFGFCDARHGGGASFTGRTDVEGREVQFRMNMADRRGGAFLCRSQTEVDFDSSSFIENAAPEGSTLHADCDCQLEISDSRFVRDKDVPNNGDFFKINEPCSGITAFGNRFIGGPDSDNALAPEEWAGIGVGIFAFLALMFCCFVVYRKRKREAAAKPTKEVEMKKTDSEEESYYDDDEDDDDDDDDDEEDEEDDEEEEEEEEEEAVTADEDEEETSSKKKGHRKHRREAEQ